MNNPLFTGVCTALVTPFINNSVNYPMLEQLLRRQMNANVKAVVLAGTTGEAPTLTDDEKIEMVRRSKEYVKDNCLIIAGTGSNDTAHAVTLSIAAEHAGADALLVVSPYYNKATPEGLFAHYMSIAHAVSIPVIIYNVPSRTGVDIPVSIYKRLSRIPNICGVKEASTDMTKITKIRIECDKSFCIWSGNDELTVPVISMGGQGVISVTSNAYPIEVSAMCDAALDGDFDTAAHIQQKLQHINDMMFCEVNPIPVKAAMHLLGYDCGECRLPLTRLSQENYQKLSAIVS